MIRRIDPDRGAALDLFTGVWATVRSHDARNRIELLAEMDLDHRTALWLVFDEGLRPVGAARLTDSRWTGVDDPAELRIALFPGHGRLLPSVIDTAGAQARAWNSPGLAVARRERRSDLGLRALLLDHGYRCAQRDVESELEIATAQAWQPTVVDGLEVTTLARRRDLTVSAQRCFELAEADEPSVTQATQRAHDAWCREYATPWASADDCLIAVIGQEVVGWANLERFAIEPSAGWHGFTGTHPRFRALGIATTLKLRLLDHARQTGLTHLRTENVEGNAPMRHINTRMGYVPVAVTEWWHSPG